MNSLALDTCVYQGAQAQGCFDASLVLTARGIDNAILQEENLWSLWVAAEAAAGALAELEAYRVENLQPVVKPRAVVEFDSGWFGVLGYLLVIWSVPWLQNQGDAQLWLAQGSMQSTAVAEGQWWRLLTALTLHGELAHLLGNSIFGAGFGLLLGRYLGSGFGWLMVLCTGVAGNAMNAALRPDGFVSIGASTATFAAVGLLGTFVWQRGYFRSGDWRRGFAPVFAAVALLALLGVGAGPVDVVAHFTGFGCGALLGYFLPRFNLRRLGASGQWLSGGLAIGLLVWCWQLALQAQ